MTSTITAVRASIAEEIAATESLVTAATVEVYEVIANGEPDRNINAAILCRGAHTATLTELRHTQVILNENDRLGFIIPNIIAAGVDNKVSQHRLGVIIDLLG